MFRAFNLSSKYGRSKAEKILLTYQTFAISVKVPTPYTTQPPCHNCVAILGDSALGGCLPLSLIKVVVPINWKMDTAQITLYKHCPHSKHTLSFISEGTLLRLRTLIN